MTMFTDAGADAPAADTTADTCTSLVKSVSVTAMLQARDAAVSRLTQALALYREACEIARAGQLGQPNWRLDEHGSCGPHITAGDALKKTLRDVDAGAWRHLMNESGLRTFMDAEARRSWDATLYTDKVPEFTFDNLKSTFTQLYSTRDEMFDRGVLSCFRKLSWNYKTNSPVKFGKRLVLTGMIGTHRYSHGGRTVVQLFFYGSGRLDQLDDLARAMHVLDGKPEPDHRDAYSNVLSQRSTSGDNTYEDALFALRWFRNGNVHLTFKRPDLVERMNQILAKHHPNALAAPH